jgi:hypothetical protein
MILSPSPIVPDIDNYVRIKRVPLALSGAWVRKDAVRPRGTFPSALVVEGRARSGVSFSALLGTRFTFRDLDEAAYASVDASLIRPLLEEAEEDTEVGSLHLDSVGAWDARSEALRFNAAKGFVNLVIAEEATHSGF